MNRNPLIGELKPVFSNCKVVGANVLPADYHRQEPHVKRGDREFVMSRSELMAFKSCPAKWIAGWEPKDTDATEWGSLMDCRILLPKRLWIDYVEQPATVKATKSMACVKTGDAQVGEDVPWAPTSAEARDWTAEQRKAGRIILTSEDYGQSTAALAILMADHRIAEVLANSNRQVMVIGQYRDPETALTVDLKGLIDLVPALGSAQEKSLVDFKTTRSAHPRTWTRAVDERDYDAQAALFLDLYAAATGEDRNTFLHILQENTAPWQPARRILSQEFVELGRLKVRSALALYCQCLSTGVWPDWDSGSPFDGWGLCEPEPWMLTR